MALNLQSLSLENGTESIEEVFGHWRSQSPEDIQKFIPELVGELAAKFNFSSDMHNAVIAAGKMAGEPLEHAFHSNYHLLEVAVMSYAMGSYAMRSGQMSDHDVGLLMTAALIHDYKHDGTTNGNNQSRLELQSFNEAKGRLQDAGLGDKDMALLKAYILSTDVSGEYSPAQRVKDYLKHGDDSVLTGDLKILATTNDQGMSHAEIAMMLHDADLSHAGFSTPWLEARGKSLATEFQAANMDIQYSDQMQAGFLSNIMKKSFASTIGRHFLQDGLKKNLRHFGVS